MAIHLSDETVAYWFPCVNNVVVHCNNLDGVCPLLSNRRGYCIQLKWQVKVDFTLACLITEVPRLIWWTKSWQEWVVTEEKAKWGEGGDGWEEAWRGLRERLRPPPWQLSLHSKWGSWLNKSICWIGNGNHQSTWSLLEQRSTTKALRQLELQEEVGVLCLMQTRGSNWSFEHFHFITKQRISLEMCSSFRNRADSGHVGVTISLGRPGKEYSGEGEVLPSLDRLLLRVPAPEKWKKGNVRLDGWQ